MNRSIDKNLSVCSACGSVSDKEDVFCQHCYANLEQRKKNSFEKTWAYLITSIILFFPANILPITYSSFLGSASSGDTIFSSVISLWKYKSYLIAVIIFLVSIVLPFFKILVLIFLLLNSSPKKAPIWQTKIYKFIHFIGRWSMIDFFVVALLSALINGNLANISASFGIFAFTGVVIFTMLATESFDIRILWDNYYDKN